MTKSPPIPSSAKSSTRAPKSAASSLNLGSGAGGISQSRHSISGGKSSNNMLQQSTSKDNSRGELNTTSNGVPSELPTLPTKTSTSTMDFLNSSNTNNNTSQYLLDSSVSSNNINNVEDGSLDNGIEEEQLAKQMIASSEDGSNNNNNNNDDEQLSVMESSDVISEVIISEEEEMRLKIESLPLPFELLKRGLSCIGPSPNGLRHVYLRLSLPNADLDNIEFLENYIYIQNLELPGNNISDITPLEHLQYLVRVDLSGNKITSIGVDLTTNPPLNLQEIDFSRNLISSIGNLEQIRFLKRLSLDYNDITVLEGLQDCYYLTHLSLSNNNISRIQGIEYLPLRYLNLSNNNISSLNGLATLTDLEELHLSKNLISSIAQYQPNCDWNPETHESLWLLDLSHNDISDNEELGALTPMVGLRRLMFVGNPLTKEVVDYGEYSTKKAHYSMETINALDEQNSKCQTPSVDVDKVSQVYRLYMSFLLPHLTVLDGIAITPEEKVAALNRYNPPESVISAVRHACKLQQVFKSYAKVRAIADNRHNGQTYLDPNSISKMCIVICGPSGVGKRTLTARLMKEFPQLFGFAISTTTRKIRSNEVNGVDYNFVTHREFKVLQNRGKFVQVAEMFGNNYATSFTEVQKVLQEGKMCLMDFEIEGLESIRKKLDPRSIYVAPPSFYILKRRLESREGHNNEKEKSQFVEKALERQQVESLYRDHQFDLTIINDDFETAYKELKETVVNWYWQVYEESSDDI